MWHPRLLATLLLCSAIAGCSDPPPEAPPVPESRVEGWVLDSILRPVPDAVVRTADGSMETETDEEGHYTLTMQGIEQTTLLATAPGHAQASRTLHFDASGQRLLANFSLSALPSTKPLIQVHQFDGFIECSAFFSAEHSHGGGGPPEGENPLDCGTYSTTQSTWTVAVPAGIEGLVTEVVWEADTQLATNLLVIVYELHENGTLEYLAFNEGPSPLKAQVPSLDVQKRFATAGTLFIDVQIGGDPDGEDIGYGAAIDQDFQGFTSIFHGQRPQVHYTVTEAKP